MGDVPFQSMEDPEIVNLADCDPSRRASKRFKGSIFGSHSSGAKMLSFSSIEDDGGNKLLYNKSQIAPSLFEKHAASQDEGVVMPIEDELRTPQICKSHAFPFDCKHSYNMWEQMDDDSVIDGVLHSTSSFSMTTVNHSVSAMLHDANGIFLMPKKPKFETLGLSPWRKELAGCAAGFQSVSKRELDWAQAVNCLIEKIDVQRQSKDGPSTVQSPQRLALTTQLMQQIFPALPSRFLNINATASPENIVYIFAKLALIDACTFKCFPGNISIEHLTGGNTIFKEPERTEKDGICSFRNVIENCLQRFWELENDFLRCREGYSISDLSMECHDLEKYATIIRFARFHEQAQPDGAENSVTTTANCEEFCERNLTVISMPAPRKLPNGLLWLQL